ncbi:YqzM family protein [Microaerobacter geothermalis]|nr:YqzM family protein [Microaerobacter geothermalis]MCF6094961.1 YqzM family protein [Microaerobacter geothermalis]
MTNNRQKEENDFVYGVQGFTFSFLFFLGLGIIATIVSVMIQ